MGNPPPHERTEGMSDGRIINHRSGNIVEITYDAGGVKAVTFTEADLPQPYRSARRLVEFVRDVARYSSDSRLAREAYELRKEIEEAE